jgi:hypothetical protein
MPDYHHRLFVGNGRWAPICSFVCDLERDEERQSIFPDQCSRGEELIRQWLRQLIFSRREADEITRLASAGASFKALDFAADRAALLRWNLSRYRIIDDGLSNRQYGLNQAC